MSPASRSKSKDKKTGKEPEKTPSKPSGFLHSVTGPVSGYNPLLGKFHALETSHISTPLSVNSNGRFRNIDETDDQTANSLGTGLDFDAVSNNGSWSGESEDTKEKTSSQQVSRQESVPGADNEKREKIRQKNEKKHQRQKERRAQELHERCSGFLMSRKLEALAQQLVVMGFSLERATMALILNEGKIEESVAWLFEGVEEEADRHKEPNNLDGGNLKIDITEELAQIADMEVKYNCSKQEVERAVVACEGDIEKAAETLRLPKEEPPFVPPKPEEIVGIQNSLRIQPRPLSLSTTNMMMMQQQQQQPQLRKEERNFNYTKAAVPTGVPNLPPSTKAGIPKLEWAKPQQVPITMDKRWPNGGSTAPTVQAAPPPPPPAKVEARYGLLSSELKNLQLGSIKEPVVVMQRPSQLISSNQKQIAPNGNISSSPPPLPPPVSGWQYQNNNNNINNNGGGLMMKSGALSSSVHNPSVTPSSLVANKLYSSSHLQYQQPQQQQQHNHHLIMADGSNQNQNQNRGNNNNNNSSSWNRMVGTSRTALSAASSLGLFSGVGSNSSSSGSSSPIDWNTSSSMFELDYASVDWSLDRSSRSVGMWQGGDAGGGGGIGGQNNNNNSGYHHNYQNQNLGFGGGGGGGRPGGAMRQMGTTNGNHGGGGGGISHMGGFLDSGGASGVVGTTTTTSLSGGEGSTAVVGGGGGGGGSREWASPFEEKDLFTLSRQFVSSPSL